MLLNHTEVDSVRIILADDHPSIRSGIRKLLEYEPEITVIAEAKDGKEALHLAQQLDPDILLLDIEMPLMTGIEVARRLKEVDSNIRILAISTHHDSEYVMKMFETGVAGYLAKDEAADLLVEAIMQIWHGETRWFSNRIRTGQAEHG
jgi:DNA-binding NarL/FixJ family response regulator